MKSILRARCLPVILALLPASSRAAMVALWRFDEPLGAAANATVRDSGPQHYTLRLGPAAEIIPGKFGHALRSLAPAQLNRGGPDVGPWVARFTTDDARGPGVPVPNPTDSPLNLGARDWTIECWLQLEPAAKAEGVIFEIGSGAAGPGELVTRFSVLPAENAFAFTGVATTAPLPEGVIARRVEYPNPEGPPGGVAVIQSTTLALGDQPMVRRQWFHVALVHIAATGELRLFLDGNARAVGRATVDSLPHGDPAYVSIGRDGRAGRPLAGAIDELRISDDAVYAREFAPPGSFSPGRRGASGPPTMAPALPVKR